MNHYKVKFSYENAPSIEVVIDSLSCLDTNAKRRKFNDKLLKQNPNVSEVTLLSN
jgi:hypothetical protein